MKKLKDYSEDIYKCSKCGFCQAACPVFQETGLETVVSRGKFTLLNGVLTGKIKFTPKLANYLDMCLGCKACYDFCPSGISAEEIVIAARAENFKVNGISFLKKLIIWCFKSNARLNLLKLALIIYKSTGFIYIAEKFSNILGKYGNVIKIFNQQLKENIKYKKLNPVKEKINGVKKEKNLKIVYFPGCINNYVNQSAKSAVVMVLEKNGIEVQIPENLSCCGISSRSAGDIKTFKTLAEHNIKLIPEDIDYLVTDCASCGSAWEFYHSLFEGELKQKAYMLYKKSININSLLEKIDIYIPDKISLNETVTYHDPCHLARFQHVTEEPRSLLKKIPGVEYREMKEADKCCGAAGTFCLVKPEISRAISEKKAHNILETSADKVCTSCSACKIGLSQGLISLKSYKEIISPVELLARLYIQEENTLF